jgi:hypothetical protein
MQIGDNYTPTKDQCSPKNTYIVIDMQNANVATAIVRHLNNRTLKEGHYVRSNHKFHFVGFTIYVRVL